MQSALQSLEAELKEAQTTMEMLGEKHKEEIKSLKEEINLLLQQRDALQSQVLISGTVVFNNLSFCLCQVCGFLKTI